MMQKSGNSQIKNIYNNLNQIINLLWIIIILTTISYVSFNAYFSENFPKFTKMMKNTGFVVLIINIIFIYLQINLIKNIEIIHNISPAYIISSIKFAYMPLISGFLLLIFSITFSATVVSDFIKKRKDLKNKQTQIYEKPIFYTPKIFEEEELISDKILSEFKINVKDIKRSYWTEAEQEHKIGLETKSEPKESEPSKDSETKKVIENKTEEEFKFTKTDVKSNFKPFPSEKSKEKSKESDILFISNPFEKALSSAIEKKQIERKSHINSDDTVEVNNEKDVKNITQNDIEVEKIPDVFNTEKKELKKKNKK